MTATELLPCPFCGSQPITVGLSVPDNNMILNCGGKDCACMGDFTIKQWNRRSQPEPQAMSAEEDQGCICKGNWREIVKEWGGLIGKRFTDQTGGEFTFFGIVHGDDDYYYGMHGRTGKTSELRLLSCVGDLEQYGFTVFDLSRKQ